MRPKSIIAVYACLAWTIAASAKLEAAQERPVLTLVRAFSDARAQFNVKALDALLSPDYVEVSPRGEVDPRAAVLGFYAPEKATPVPPMTLGTQVVRVYGDTAVVIGSVEYTLPGPGGAMVKRTVRVTYLERRINGRWLMAGAQYTGVQPAAQPAPR